MCACTGPTSDVQPQCIIPQLLSTDRAELNQTTTFDCHRGAWGGTLFERARGDATKAERKPRAKVIVRGENSSTYCGGNEAVEKRRCCLCPWDEDGAAVGHRSIRSSVCFPMTWTRAISPDLRISRVAQIAARSAPFRRIPPQTGYKYIIAPCDVAYGVKLPHG